MKLSNWYKGKGCHADLASYVNKSSKFNNPKDYVDFVMPYQFCIISRVIIALAMISIIIIALCLTISSHAQQVFPLLLCRHQSFISCC